MIMVEGFPAILLLVVTVVSRLHFWTTRGRGSCCLIIAVFRIVDRRLIMLLCVSQLVWVILKQTNAFGFVQIILVASLRASRQAEKDMFGPQPPGPKPISRQSPTNTLVRMPTTASVTGWRLSWWTTPWPPKGSTSRFWTVTLKGRAKVLPPLNWC